MDDPGDNVVVNAADRFAADRSAFVHGATAPAYDDFPVVDVEPEDVADGAPVARSRAGELLRRLAARARARRRVPVPAERLVGRDRRAARRRAVVAAAGSGVVRAGVRTGRGGGRVVWVVAAGVGRWVWVPEQAGLVERMVDPESTTPASTALHHRKELSRTRATRLGVLAAAGSVGWFAAPVAVDRLLAVVEHWWQWGAAGLVVGAGCWAAGAVHGDDAQERGEGLPRGLAAGDSERSVRRDIAEAFAELKVRGQVVKVRVARTSPSWGWEVTAELLTDLTEKHVRALALRLDTRVGGVLVSGVEDSSRSRVFRLVLVDLLTPGQAAPALTVGDQDSSRTPVALARRYDGELLHLVLAGLHLLLIGRIGSGKSTAMHRLVEAFLELGAVVGGIDLSGGADLRSWEPMLDPRFSAIGDRTADALDALDRACAVAADRKRRLGRNQAWASSRDDPPVRIVIDEYGLVAASPAMLERVGWLALYGRHVDVCLVLANHRLTQDMNGDGKVASQVQVKMFFGMDGADAVRIGKGLRDQGVAPELLTPAHDQVPNDAGKAFVTGVGSTPFLVRFAPYRHGEAARRADALAARRGRAALGAADERVLAHLEATDVGVPVLVCDVLEAIEAHTGRDPMRASSAEIAEWLRRHKGHVDVTVNTLTPRLRDALGAAFPANRTQDMNLPGGNQKGWRRDELLAAVEVYRQLDQPTP